MIADLDAAYARERRFVSAADTNSSGAGLGLSIVKSVAQIHDARVVLSESDLGGLCVTVEFKIN